MSRALMLLFVTAMLIPAHLAWAHPPERVELEFDLAEHLLKITAFHTVRDSSEHYVDRIVVELNGEETIRQTFKSQLNSESQAAVYKIIDSKPEDEILVSVACNIAGRKEVTIKVEEVAEMEEETPMKE